MDGKYGQDIAMVQKLRLLTTSKAMFIHRTKLFDVAVQLADISDRRVLVYTCLMKVRLEDEGTQ